MQVFLWRLGIGSFAFLALLPLLFAEAGQRRRRFSGSQAPAAAAPAPAPARPMRLTYPASKKVDYADEYHGTKVPDPYRWLEELDSDETKKWIEEQNKVT